jgi:hypothetical protein
MLILALKLKLQAQIKGMDKITVTESALRVHPPQKWILCPCIDGQGTERSTQIISSGTTQTTSKFACILPKRYKTHLYRIKTRNITAQQISRQETESCGAVKCM